MSEENDFLSSIRSAPADDAPRLVFADWLDERADPRGPFLRDECRAAAAFRAGDSAPATRLRKAALRLDPGWAMSVARPPVGVCTSVTFTQSGPPLAAADLDGAEKRAGLILPPDYRAFLLAHNGGKPRPDQFEYDGNESEGPEMIQEFLALNLREGLTSVHRLYGGHVWNANEEQMRTMIPIGIPGSDEDCLALSVARDDLGAVYYQTYIEGLQEPVPIADSFAAFLALIRDHRLNWVRMAEDGDAAGLGQWLDAGGDPLVQDPINEFTPLDYAICYGREEVVRTILDRRPTFSRRATARTRQMIRQYENPAIRHLVETYLGNR